jgi:hypothetical protein
MSPDDADLVLALEPLRSEVDGVYALGRPPPGWPRLFVGLRDDTAHTLGVVTALMVRALPHRDRSHVGIAATDRLRELWQPMGMPISLSRAQRRDAVARAEERERKYREEPTPLMPRVRVEVEPAPVSVPALGPFQPGLVWMMSGRRVVVLEVVGDPFRTVPRPLLVITEDDRMYRRLAEHAPRDIMLARARTVPEAIEAIGRATPVCIVCSEALALGVSSDVHAATTGMLSWIEATRPELASCFEIVCSEGTADWVASYLQSRASTRILEEPLDDDAVDELMQRARR